MDKERLAPETRAITGVNGHFEAGEPIVAPLYQTTIFSAGESQKLGELFHGRSDDFYIRIGNPTVGRAGRMLAVLESGEEAVMFASGMAAITTTVMALVRAGDYIVAHSNLYGQTLEFLIHLEERFGVKVVFTDLRDPTDLPPKAALILAETPSNPLLDVVDVAAAKHVANRLGARLVVDSTFATPALQKPLTQGADIVIHSCTKYLGGHSDLAGGVAVGDAETMDVIARHRDNLGGIMDPFAAWLLLRSLKTLALRCDRHSANALRVAEFLEGQPAVRSVLYPLLPSHPDHAVATEQMRAGGGMVSFWMKGGIGVARSLLDGLQLIPKTTSLGGVESVIEIPGELDYGSADDGGPTAKFAGHDCLVRLSVGIEAIDDLISDLDEAFRRLAKG